MNVSTVRGIWLAPLLLACHSQNVAPAAIAPVSEPVLAIRFLRRMIIELSDFRKT